MKARPISAPLYLWSDKKQNASDIVMNKAAELTALKVIENRRSCNPQSVLTNPPKPSTTIVTTCAISSDFETPPEFFLQNRPSCPVPFTAYSSLWSLALSFSAREDRERWVWLRLETSLFAFHQKDWVMGQLRTILWDKETVASYFFERSGNAWLGRSAAWGCLSSQQREKLVQNQVTPYV